MEIENRIEMIKLLIDKTEKDQAIWKKTARNSEYILKFASGSLTTDMWTDRNTEQECVDFIIYNNKGQQIENYYYPVNSTGPGAFLYKLYNTIVRRELRADETISEIMEELANDSTVGTSDDEIPF